MNKKIATGAIILLTAAVILFFYKRKKNKIDEVAAEEYDKLSYKIKYAEIEPGNIDMFS